MKKIIFTIFGIWIGLILVACSSRTSNTSINNSTSSTTSLATSSTDKEAKYIMVLTPTTILKELTFL